MKPRVMLFAGSMALVLCVAGCQRRIVGARGFGADAAVTAPGARVPKSYATTGFKPRKERPVLENVRRTPSRTGPLGPGGGYGSGLSGEVNPPDGADPK